MPFAPQPVGSRGIMRLWQLLTARRDIPEIPNWVAVATLLCLSVYLGWVAVSPEGPPVDRDVAQLLQGSRESIALSEAVISAVRDNDQRRVEEVREKLAAQSRLEADREARRVDAVKTARRLYGVIAALLFTAGAWLLLAGRKSSPVLSPITVPNQAMQWTRDGGQRDG